jgi:vesicle-associated membrane protein 7
LQAVAYEFNGSFSTVLAQRMTYFNSDPGADVIDRVRGEISQVRFRVWVIHKVDGFLGF